ncbi:MAG: dockerin type I repeat-containing protein [Planctomycetota bacterium]
MLLVFRAITQSGLRIAASLLATITLTSLPVFGAGDVLQVVDVREAGSVYLGAAGTTLRYVSGLGPTTTFYEERLAQGQVTGNIRKVPSLVGPMPASAAPLSLNFFEADGVTPFFDTTLQHPRLLATPLGPGMYVSSNLPNGPIYFFVAVDAGATSWRFVGSIPVSLFAGGSGFLGVIRIPNPSHAEGVEVRVYNQDGGGRITVLQSFGAALGLNKYVMLNSLTTLPLSIGGAEFSPTGEVFILPNGNFGIFFVPQDESYLGLAEATNGLGPWTITRGAVDPILSSASNLMAPDPARPNIAEVTLSVTPTGFAGYFTGAVPGMGSSTTAIGSLRLDFLADFRRGDCNMDGAVDVADILCQLGFLFLDSPLPCIDAADTNDDGNLELGDLYVLIQYEYLAGPAPPTPFPGCGVDPTFDNLACVSAPAACP